MGKIACSFYPSLIIILTILGTSFAAAEVTLNNFFIYVLQYSLSDEINGGGACGTFGRGGRGVHRVLVSRAEGKDHLEDLG